MTKMSLGKLLSVFLLLTLLLTFCFDTFGHSKQAKRKPQSIYQPIDDQSIKRVEPTYDKYHLRIETDVVVQVHVDEKGNVTSAHAISGHPLLRSQALFAAKDWKFSSKICNGKPVKNRGTITFHFMPVNRRPNVEDKEKNA